jgi:hypothetical protein
VITIVKKLATSMQCGKNGNKYGGHDFTVGIEVLINSFFQEYQDLLHIFTHFCCKTFHYQGRVSL